MAALQRYISHKDNLDFKIWHKNQYMGKITLNRKKNSFRQQLAAF